MNSRSESGTVVHVRLWADNPGPDALPLKEVRYTLSLDGREVFTGVRSAQATVPRFGTQAFVLPAALPGVSPSSEGGLEARAYRLVGTIEYQEPGALADVLFDVDIVRPRVSFDVSGALEPERPV